MSGKPVPYRQVLGELLEIWDGAASRRVLETRTDIHDPRVPVLTRGLTAHAADCARGVLTLFQNSQPVPAIPLVRCLMEDAITAARLFAVEDAWRSFITEGATNRAKALRMIQEYDPEDLAAGEQLVAAEEIIAMFGRPSGHKIEQRMNALEGTENWYLMYRAASTLTHAGSGVVDLYFESDESTDLGVAFRNHASFGNASSYLAVAAANFLHTLSLWDLCQPDQPDKQALDAIKDRLDLHPAYRAK
jgi:hypothetical protein